MSFELTHNRTTVILLSAFFYDSLYNKATNSSSLTIFFNIPLCAAWIKAFSIDNAFSGLTNLIFDTTCMILYIDP